MDNIMISCDKTMLFIMTCHQLIQGGTFHPKSFNNALFIVAPLPTVCITSRQLF